MVSYKSLIKSLILPLRWSYIDKAFTTASISSAMVALAALSMLLVVILIIILPYKTFALEDDLKKAVEISSHGAKFQSERIKVVSENIANATSTSSTPGGNPYRRKIIFADNKYNKNLGTNVISTKKVDLDNSDFIMRFDPNHPAANDEGYVKYPNINKEIERSDVLEAQNSYEANLTIMEVTNSLIQKTVEAIR